MANGVFSDPTSEGAVDALAANHRLSRAEGIDAVLGTHRLDAVVCPTMGPAYPIDHGATGSGSTGAPGDGR